MPELSKEKISNLIEGFADRITEEKSLIIETVQSAADTAASMIFDEPYSELSESQREEPTLIEFLNMNLEGSIERLSGKYSVIANAILYDFVDTESSPQSLVLFPQNSNEIRSTNILLEAIFNDTEIQIGSEDNSATTR